MAKKEYVFVNSETQTFPFKQEQKTTDPIQGKITGVLLEIVVAGFSSEYWTIP